MISDCTADLADLFGLNEANLLGRHVRSLIPDLPLQPETEGYNVAFVAFTSKRNETRQWLIRRDNASPLLVSGYLSLLKTPNGFAFNLELASALAVDNDMPRPASPVALTPPALPRNSGCRIDGQARAANFSRRRFHAQLPQADSRFRLVRLTIDSQYRIGFACSAVEELFGLNYEGIVGTPISSLLPDLPIYLEGARSLKTVRSRLQKLGSLLSHARHADGRSIPALVCLQQSSFDRLIPLLLRVPAC